MNGKSLIMNELFDNFHIDIGLHTYVIGYKGWAVKFDVKCRLKIVTSERVDGYFSMSKCGQMK